MVTAQEIVVAVTSEGAEQTKQDVEDVEQSMGGVAGNVGQAADELGGFATKFAGAMTAVLGGLAVATAGLLSQVPVIRELFGGLGAVIDGLAFQLDQKLRPSIQPLTDELYDLSAALFEGDWDQAEQEVKDFANELGKIDFEAGVEDITDFAINTVDDIVSAFNTQSEELTTEDFRTAADAFLDTFRGAVFKAIQDIEWVQLAINLAKLLGKAIIGSVEAFKNNMAFPIQIVVYKAISKAWENAKEWGKELIEKLIEGIKQKASDLQQTLEGIELTAGVTIGDISGGVGDLLSGGRGGGGGLTANRGNVTVKSFIDGREAARGTSATRFDETSRRGTFR